MMFSIFLMLISPINLIAEDKVSGKLLNQIFTKNELVQKVYNYAEVYKVNPKTMIKIINCENREWDTKLQSRIKNNKGQREDSWGLSQIHLPSHPVSKEQATDPDFALDFMAKNLSKGKGNMWTCFKKNA